MRALMGTADTPALPISGLIFLFLGRMRLKSFTNSTPLLEAITKAMKPRKKMKIVCGVRNCEACVDAPTVMPRRMVTMSVSAFEAVFCKTGCHAALTQQVAEEEHAQQRKAGGHHEAGEKHAHDGEDDFLVLAHGARGLHFDETLFLCGEQAHQRGLDYRHQSHVGICRYCDGAHEVGSELRRQEDGGGSVGAADDGDSAGLVGAEAQQEGYHVCAEDAELCGGADEHELGIGNQGREVGRGTDAKENQRVGTSRRSRRCRGC